MQQVGSWDGEFQFKSLGMIRRRYRALRHGRAYAGRRDVLQESSDTIFINCRGAPVARGYTRQDISHRSSAVGEDVELRDLLKPTLRRVDRDSALILQAADIGWGRRMGCLKITRRRRRNARCISPSIVLLAAKGLGPPSAPLSAGCRGLEDVMLRRPPSWALAVRSAFVTLGHLAPEILVEPRRSEMRAMTNKKRNPLRLSPIRQGGRRAYRLQPALHGHHGLLGPGVTDGRSDAERLAMILFMTARSAGALIVARALQGFATGLAITTLAATILDTDNERKPVLNSFTVFAGLSAGTESSI